MSTAPYKFLDYYIEDDQNIFFGREKEIRMLVADIISSRLVVLFARTGTGKTSLIRAGVMPRLAARGYVSFYSQAKEDPWDSLNQALSEQGVPLTRHKSLPDQARAAVQHTGGKPIVLIFDQFEEFIFGIEQRDPELAEKFTCEIATIYKDPKTRTHILFSLREDFYGGMDIFRKEIPSIFSKGSSLRLLPLGLDQAREAVIKPAMLFGLVIENDLVDHLLADLQQLSGSRSIEPAQIQIVCHTLWRDLPPGAVSITMKDYEKQGGAKSILSRRLRADLSERLSLSQLASFSGLMDLLTDRQKEVKRPQPYDELPRQLKAEPGEIDALITALKEIGLVRTRKLDNTLYVEWVTDYVAKNVSDIEKSVAVIRVEKAFASFLADLRRLETGSDLDEGVNPAGQLPEQFEQITRSARLLSLSAENARLMLLKALEFRIGIHEWFELAQANALDVWQILKELIVLESPSWEEEVQANNTVEYLGVRLKRNLDEKQAVELLRLALQKDSLARQAVKALGEAKTSQALDELRRAAEQEQLTIAVIQVLGSTPSSIDLLINIMRRELDRGSLAALDAARHLYRISLSRSGKGPGKGKNVFNKAIKRRDVARFLDLALEYDYELGFWFNQAERLGVDVQARLARSLQPGAPAQESKGAMRLMGEMGSPWAVEQLQAAARQPAFSTEARLALQQILDNKRGENRKLEADLKYALSNPQAAGASAQEIQERINANQRVIQECLKALAEPLEEQAAPPSIEAPPPRRVPFSAGERWDPSVWSHLLLDLKEGRLLPVIGPGVSAVGEQFLSDTARSWAEKYSYPLSGPAGLADVAEYVRYEIGRRNQIALFQNAMTSLIERSSSGGSDPADPYHLLAGLPLPRYVTFEYHTLLEQALLLTNRKPRSVTSIQEDMNRSWYDHPSTPAEPLVYHLYGSVSAPESLLLSEDDLLDFAIGFAAGNWRSSTELLSTLSTSTMLILGVDRSDLGYRTLQHYLGDKSIRRRDYIVVTVSKQETDSIAAHRYLDAYFNQAGYTAYWGSAQDFLTELTRRFQAEI